MANNNLLWNAAVNGFIAGALAGANQTDPNGTSPPTPTDFATLATLAGYFAGAVDTAIANDNTISAANGTASPNAGSSGLVEYQSSKPQLLYALCFGVTFQRYPYFPAGMTGAQFQALYSANIATVVAIYTQALTAGVYT